jgi:murein DD-endopeptidase MepM/ murein hydrolase activator NlpD
MRRSVLSLLCGVVVFSLAVSQRSFAEDLILEFDPDEEIRSEESVPIIPPPTVVAPAASSDQFRAGYHQLFEFNEQEIAGLKAVLFPLGQDISSIDSQVQYIDAQIQRMQYQEGIVQTKVMGLEQLHEKLRIQDQLLALEMKGIVKKFEKLMVFFYRIKREFVMEDGRVNLAQLFSNTASPSEVLFQDYLLQKIQRQLLDQMGMVSNQQYQLDLLRAELTAIRDQLNLYRERLGQSAAVLAQQSQFQQQLLADKRDEQRFFQNELEAAIEEQKIIARRIQELAGGIPYRTYENFPVETLQWPVTPALGVSADFHDEGYHSRFGIEHNAIDIPTDQLTPVRAPLSGQVVKVHDGGATGYSYLQLAHRDGLSTVYGHVYSMKVQEGQVVQQGEVIALSGGAIGTHGAGRLTTGPHLHFEVLLNGKYVDPLEYLGRLE